MLKTGYVTADSDGLVYSEEDTEWGAHPDGSDKGWRIPKKGILPVKDGEISKGDIESRLDFLKLLWSSKDAGRLPR